MMPLPDSLSHYYEASDGPFRNLSDLPGAEAEAVLQRIRRAGDRFASQRLDDYLSARANWKSGCGAVHRKRRPARMGAASLSGRRCMFLVKRVVCERK